MDDDGLDSPHEDNVHCSFQSPNELDLNVKQDCCSLNGDSVNGSRSNFLLECTASADAILKIGTEFESDEHAYNFYNKYAGLVGFSVRKDWVNRSKVHGQVVSRKFTCSKEGYRRKDKRDVNVKKHRKETRTGCLAHMIITRQSDGKYRVTHFEAKHNHDNINPSNAQTIPLQEQLTVGQAADNNLANDLGPTPKSECQLMNQRFRLRESLDYLALDYKNFLQSERTRDMKDGKVGRLLHYFQRQHFDNPSFFYAVQLDINDKVSNILWADDNMVADYDHFGDIIGVNTTSRANQDLLPFVQFIGVNNHKQVVTFSAALLYDDTVESFKWLLRVFIEAMSGKKPKAIVTDQDAMIIEAINSVLPETEHCICIWQMYQSTMRHLSRLVKDNESFANDFRNCIYGHKHEDDFIRDWETMMEKYNLQQNDWMRWMFKEREKWAPVYGRNTFFLDMGKFHLGENLFNDLSNCLNANLDMLQFIHHFERVVDAQRCQEMEAIHEMRTCMPRLMGNVVLLKHASDIYTPRAFEVFQQGYEKCLDLVVTKCSESGLLHEYKAKTFGQTREYTITFDSSNNTIVCSCSMFEHVGFLCSHALKVLDHRNIKVVSPCYILKRWTRDARVGTADKANVIITQENPDIVAASRYKDLCYKMIKLSARASQSEEAFQYATKQIHEIMEGIEKILTLKLEKTQPITSSTTGANGSKCEPTENFLDGSAIEDQDDNNVINEAIGRERAVSHRSHLPLNEEDSNGKRAESLEINIVSCISSPLPAYAQPTTPNPILQGLYNFDANQGAQCMYQQSNLVVDRPPQNADLFQPPSFSNHYNSPGQSQFLQEAVIQKTYQEPGEDSTQMRQAMDLDTQHPHASSSLLYDHRYRNS